MSASFDRPEFLRLEVKLSAVSEAGVCVGNRRDSATLDDNGKNRFE